MHLVDESDAVPLTSIDELVAHFRDASKPRAAWRVGTEHELIGVRARPTHGAVGSAPPYDGPDGIGAVLARFAARGWQPVIEAGNTIALTCTDSQISMSSRWVISACAMLCSMKRRACSPSVSAK